MIAQKNNTTFIVTDGKSKAYPTAATPVADLVEGQLGVYVNGAAVETVLGANDYFQVVGRDAEGVLVQGPHIKMSDVRSKFSEDPTTEQLQITYIGYDGTAGNISYDPIKNNYVTIEINDGSKSSMRSPIVVSAGYEPVATDTNLSFAYKLAQAINTTVSKQDPILITAATSSDGVEVISGVDGTDTAINLTFEHGSNIVATSADMGSYVTPGDYIGPNKFNMSLVTAVTPTEITLADKYLGSTLIAQTSLSDGGSGAVPGSFRMVDDAAVAAAPAGVTITAKSIRDIYIPGIISYNVVSFGIVLSPGMVDSGVRVDRRSIKASGSYETVSYNEWFLFGNTSEPWRVGSYPDDKELTTDTGTSYKTYTLNYINSRTDGLDGKRLSYATLMICAQDGEAIAATLDTVLGL